MGEDCAPFFGHVVAGNSDRLDSLRCVIKLRKIYLDPLRLVLPMSKAKCVTNDLKRGSPLRILLREGVPDHHIEDTSRAHHFGGMLKVETAI